MSDLPLCEWVRGNAFFEKRLTPAKRRHLVPDVQLTEDTERCLRTLTSLGRIYNLQLSGETPWSKACCLPGQVVVNLHGYWATNDMNELTRLVIAAHRNHVRVGISPQSMTTVRFTLHARSNEPTGHGWEHHPGLNEFEAMILKEVTL